MNAPPVKVIYHCCVVVVVGVVVVSTVVLRIKAAVEQTAVAEAVVSARSRHTHRSYPFFTRMGAQQSRRVDNDTSPGESDSSWMNRVQVKPSEILVARLQQASSSAEAQRSEPPALEEDHTEEQEERNQAVRREREGYLREVRMEEVRVGNTAAIVSEIVKFTHLLSHTLAVDTAATAVQ